MLDDVVYSAQAMYDELTASVSLPSVRDAYRVYSRILRVAADQKTSFEALHLGSLYAKIDYLSRECHLAHAVVHRVNDTRVRLRRQLALTDDELSACRLYDLRAICMFIAAVYGEQVPVGLQALFPADERRAVDVSIVADCFRLCIVHFDDTFLYGTCEELPDVEEVKVCYHFTGGNLNGDWTYLYPLLAKDTKINVIRPRLYNGVYYPELLILHPDYLIDITTITACFEGYAHDAVLHLINKLKPDEVTAPILLGNLAGQLLDEEVHGTGQGRYEDIYTDFMRSNAFKVMTSGATSLHDDGLKQQDNIHRALNDGLQQRVGRYDRTQVMLEPSFFSEMLGLQGRMDFLQLDGKVLIEQKSGKGEFVAHARPDDPPRVQLKHYVQLLLYQAILNYNYAIPNREVQTLLLYSKYVNGLVGVSAAPSLLHEALRIRNQIAALETECCRRGFGRLLSLRADSLRQLTINDSFWQKYCLPALQSVLLPLQQAPSLERAYVLRFLQFVAGEQMLSKVGSMNREGSGSASRWHESLEEKRQAGSIYDDLTLVSPDEDFEGRVMQLTFRFAIAREGEMSNFRLGDIVVAYQYEQGTVPDIRRTMVFRGTLTDISSTSLTMVLRAPQTDCHVFWYRPSQQRWAVEHDFMESSYKSMYSGIFALLKAPDERRELLLMQRAPRTDVSRQLRGSYGAFDALSLRVRQAEDFFLIIGPPGTGKTSYGMLNTLREQLLEPGSSILITSFTNRAVDEVCSKLVEEGIDFVRMGGPYSCSAGYRSHLLERRLQTAQDTDSMRDLVRQTRVFVGTTTAFSSNMSLFSIKAFDLAIIDEASQILEPHIMGLLTAVHDGKPAIRKFVMIGDHKQLPAVVQQTPRQSRVTDEQLRNIGLTDCRLSLFERLLSRYRDCPEVTYMLTHQGRMHPAIAGFPNCMFYGGKLQVVPLEHQQEQLPTMVDEPNPIDRMLATQRVVFLPVATSEPVISDKVNETEAQLIAAIAERIYVRHAETFRADTTLGVIVPYRNQIAAVRNALEVYNHPALLDISIDTVERYQGSQRDYILYGFTIQRPYQLNFLASNTFEEDGQLIDRKLNVAMTRARKHLIMLGNPDLLRQNPVFAALIEQVPHFDLALDSV